MKGKRNDKGQQRKWKTATLFSQIAEQANHQFINFPDLLLFMQFAISNVSKIATESSHNAKMIMNFNGTEIAQKSANPFAQTGRKP